MALGDIAKQLAQQALVDQVTPKPSSPAQAESVGAVMLGEIQAMQRACKEDEELVVLFRSGPETVRVFEIIVPSWPVMVLAGVDESRHTTRVVTTAESVQLVCKVMKVQPPAKPARLGFRIPKPKPE
jgi:hypothetical protein